MGCEVCEKVEKIESGEHKIILETKHFYVRLNPEQSYIGRLYIPMKRHCISISDMTDEEIIDFRNLVKTMETAITKAFGAFMFNWTCMMNNAIGRGATVHVHWHCRPRYNKKVEFAGKVFEDPEFGYHYNRDRKDFVSEELQSKIIEKIKEFL